MHLEMYSSRIAGPFKSVADKIPGKAIPIAVAVWSPKLGSRLNIQHIQKSGVEDFRRDPFSLFLDRIAIRAGGSGMGMAYEQGVKLS